MLSSSQNSYVDPMQGPNKQNTKRHWKPLKCTAFGRFFTWKDKIPNEVLARIPTSKFPLKQIFVHINWLYNDNNAI